MITPLITFAIIVFVFWFINDFEDFFITFSISIVFFGFFFGVNSFNDKKLSNAVKCYKTVSTDYSLKLQLNRHKAAKLLRAEIKQLKIVSIVSEEGNIITNMMISLNNIGIWNCDCRTSA